MNGKMREWFRNSRWALAASLFLHALIATFLFYGLPRPEQQPDQQEQPVNVAIVPPPEQPKPKPEKKAEKPPEQKPPPELPKLPDDRVLKRVFQYGKKDTGPEKSLEGESAKPNASRPAKDEPAKPVVAPTPASPQFPQPASPEQQAQSSKPEEKSAAVPPDAKSAQSEEKQATEDNDKQQPENQEEQPQTADQQAAETPKPLTAETGSKPAPPTSVAKAKPKPVKTMTFKPARAFRAPSGNAGRSNPTNNEVAGSPVYAGLPGVRKLYSQGATGDMFATSSMDNVPRGLRVATLCGNVLSRELQNADYPVKWVPTIELDKGNILNPPLAAFSTRKTWYNLSFRCEVDDDATRVRSFNFRVGSLIPRGEWASRDLVRWPLN
ncbi:MULTISPECIES: DUF930 domain-containing protein [unclassified Mesorhizobium]|uniref:DUF930 domain-containing protein n=1 Tax=unclassified Mesorhizobium TaxID=325217 RepID=UPI000FDC66DE|nr:MULTISPECIES: DUF930 domain-containing protein [unclassified Mesorhizobium]TGQ09103.1 DUF930 domain-containing protein [Mesorhizobium sp. M2E.F.Ca.ET.219.01.1.1]TGT69640.1 DUF930 domain-containing protein [Mesorhizobium sp. M2E.F.Ca.ET.166.01.1.1]TGW02022.1 DUF930 domain-containing protein [Mesorhizobium sp. M2E.F.Ca.ET.154.01.1.1]